ncbi:MAG: hypothetical protein M5U08_08640 [Burkholderiales bacterium]|nr:hypothetical protein [Burkholderiales bacterium]
MHIVAIAWLFVTVLMAAAEASLTAAVMTLVFYGVAPLALFWWLVGTPVRRARRRRSAAVSKLSGEPDHQHAEPDQ